MVFPMFSPFVSFRFLKTTIPTRHSVNYYFRRHVGSKWLNGYAGLIGIRL
jgi:hypothetical protein